eukprot:7463227-Alexandrium_andersonii.AAC.1
MLRASTSLAVASALVHSSRTAEPLPLSALPRAPTCPGGRGGAGVPLRAPLLGTKHHTHAVTMHSKAAR